MGDFPPAWVPVRDFPETGQGYTFEVRRADGSDAERYVLKRLKNPKREDYFQREIQAYRTLAHPNVLPLVEEGRTPKGRPYLVTPYCEGGSLDSQPVFPTLLEGLRCFQQICAGVAHAHEHGIAHLDLKPTNILLTESRPVVGDFGICYLEEDHLAMTSEGPRGSIYYCAPELRGPKLTYTDSPPIADIYSLGKVLYWLYTHEVYDGSEDDYSQEPSRHLARLYPEEPLFVLVDEVIAATVLKNPHHRFQAGFPNAQALLTEVGRLLERVQAGGRALDLRVPQRCLYCATGVYRPIPLNSYPNSQYAGPTVIGSVESRFQQRSTSQPQFNSALNEAAGHFLGHNYGAVNGAALLILICDYCGNFQQFRLDKTRDGYGQHWRP